MNEFAVRFYIFVLYINLGSLLTFASCLIECSVGAWYWLSSLVYLF